MKESKLLEMQNKVAALTRVVQQLINEIDNIANGTGFNDTNLINSSIKQIDSDMGTGRTGEISLDLSNIIKQNKCLSIVHEPVPAFERTFK